MAGFQPTDNERLTPELLIAARTLLGYTQEEWAALSDVGVSTLRQLERQRRKQSLNCSTRIYERLVDAFRSEGVQFYRDHSGEDGTRRTVILYDWEDRRSAGN